MGSRFNISESSNPGAGPFDRQELISWFKQENLRNARVMVVGAGAIGNEVIKNLALMGIGYMLIVDFDFIETSNLSRTVLFRATDVGKRKAQVAAERAKELCAEESAQVDWHHGDLVWEIGAGVYRSMDLVLSCLDNVEARLSINRYCFMTQRPWIDSGIRELGCRLNVFDPPNLPCYQCTLTQGQIASRNKRYSCHLVKRRHVLEDTVPTTQIASSFIAALQTQEAVKILCNQRTMAGKRLYFQGLTNDFDIVDLVPDPECPAHTSITEIRALEINRQASVREFLQLAGRVFNLTSAFALDLRADFNFIISATCRACGQKLDLNKPAFQLFDADLSCLACKQIPHVEREEELTTIEALYDIGLHSGLDTLLDLTLEQLGFPLLHVANIVDADGNSFYAEVTGDSVGTINSLRTHK